LGAGLTCLAFGWDKLGDGKLPKEAPAEDNQSAGASEVCVSSSPDASTPNPVPGLAKI